MNLYLIEGGSGDYDTYDSAVVAAPDDDAARCWHPRGHQWSGSYMDRMSWSRPDQVTVTLIGTAKPSTDAGVICASFNAG